MITAANFQTYAQENRLAGAYFWFVDIEDSNANNYYYTDYHTEMSNYIPSLVEVSPAFYEASLFEGLYSVRPLQVRISNIAFPDAGATTKRFSENFSSNELETELCTIYLGYEGITSTSDFLPVYKGRMSNFKYDLLGFSFTVIDQFVFELPEIPSNKFTRASFSNISEDAIGKPIPICYGRWDNEASGTTRYRPDSFIPAFITSYDLDLTSPQIVLEAADNELDAINKVYIYDPNLNAIGEVQDDITESLANARATIDLNTANDDNFITAVFYLYPDRIVSTTTSGNGVVSNPENSIDGDFDTITTMQIDSFSDVSAMEWGFPTDPVPFSRDDMTPIFTVSGNTECVAFKDVELEISAYSDDTWTSGETMRFRTLISPSFTLDSFDVSNLFNDQTWTSVNSVSGTDIEICYNYKFDGSTKIFEIDEDNGGTPVTADVNPDEGYYPTMEEVAEEIDRQLDALSDAGTLANTYSASYNKIRDRILVKRVSGSRDFRCNSGGQSGEIGYTEGSPSYVSGTFEGGTTTTLGIADGDFSIVGVKAEIVSTQSNTIDFHIKGIRLKITRTYKKYNISQSPSVRGGRRTSDRPNRRSPLGGSRRGRRDRNRFIYRTENAVDQESILQSVVGSQFFFSADGYPTGATYFKKGPEIIKSLLEDYLGVASGLIDSTAFSTANTNASIELGLYLDTESNPLDVFANIARFSRGFVHFGQDGKYKCAIVKSSYSGGDVDSTIYYRDIKTPLHQNLKFERNEIREISSDLYLHYQWNWAKSQWNSILNQSTTSALNIQSTNLFAENVTDHDQASTVADYFCGDGGTTGQFGEPKAVAEITLLNGEYHLNELGDIIQFDSEYDSKIDAFGGTLSSLYFMVVGKKFGKKEITFKLLEVG